MTAKALPLPKPRVWFNRGRTFAAYTHHDANGKTVTTVLLGALRVHHEHAKRGSLAWQFAPGKGRPWFGRGSMGLCFAWRPWYVAFRHNERPEDRDRRINGDRAREVAAYAERIARGTW